MEFADPSHVTPKLLEVVWIHVTFLLLTMYVGHLNCLLINLKSTNQCSVILTLSIEQPIRIWLSSIYASVGTFQCWGDDSNADTPFCHYNYCSQSEHEQSCLQMVNTTFSMAVKSGSLMEELLTSSLCLQRWNLHHKVLNLGWTSCYVLDAVCLSLKRSQFQ